jgi:hypothetical protein
MDIQEKAEEAGIEMPVEIDKALLERLTPNLYLASLGLSLDKRVEQLLNLLAAHIRADVNTRKMQAKYFIPFMAVRGPLVSEDYFPVIARVSEGEDGREMITLKAASENDSE